MLTSEDCSFRDTAIRGAPTLWETQFGATRKFISSGIGKHVGPESASCAAWCGAARQPKRVASDDRPSLPCIAPACELPQAADHRRRSRCTHRKRAISRRGTGNRTMRSRSKLVKIQDPLRRRNAPARSYYGNTETRSAASTTSAGSSTHMRQKSGAVATPDVVTGSPEHGRGILDLNGLARRHERSALFAASGRRQRPDDVKYLKSATKINAALENGKLQWQLIRSHFRQIHHRGEQSGQRSRRQQTVDSKPAR